MSDEALNEIKGLITAQGEQIKALETVVKNAPPISNLKAGVVVTHDEADTSYKTLYPRAPMGKFLEEVRDNALTGRMTPQLKAILGANESLQSEGGFLVQTDQAPGVDRKMFPTGDILNRCDTVTISAGANSVDFYGRDEDSRANGSRSAGITAYRVAEAATITASGAMKFYRYTLKPKDYAALYYATNDVLQDSALLESEVMEAIPTELGFMIEEDIVAGLGAAGCTGYTVSPALVTVAKESGQAASTFTFTNAVKMYSRMFASSVKNAVWLLNQNVMPQLLQMNVAVGVAGQAVYLPPNGAADAPFGTLLGRPILWNEHAAGLGAVGDVQFVDLSQYKVATKGGMQFAASIHVQFVTAQMAYRFITRVDGQSKWKSALTPFKGTAETVSPFVVLAVRS